MGREKSLTGADTPVIWEVSFIGVGCELFDSCCFRKGCFDL